MATLKLEPEGNMPVTDSGTHARKAVV